jgi:molecular chaperone Hsp33
MKKDTLLTAIAYNKTVRIIIARTTNLVFEAQQRHKTYPTASAALGRTLTGGLLLSSMLKGQEKYSIRLYGDGPLKEIFVDATAQGTVRGYVHNPEVDIPLNGQGKLDVRGALGSNGMMTVIKNLGLNQNFTGQVPLVSGEIAEDFTYYLSQSEQIPSSVGLGVLVNTDGTIASAGGFLIQGMPGCTEQTLISIEKSLSQAPPISKILQGDLELDQIIPILLGGEAFSIIHENDISFQCNCSRHRTEQTLMLLGKDELIDMIDVQKGAEVNCNFCNEHYQFSADDLNRLVQELITH